MDLLATGDRGVVGPAPGLTVLRSRARPRTSGVLTRGVGFSDWAVSGRVAGSQLSSGVIGSDHSGSAAGAGVISSSRGVSGWEVLGPGDTDVDTGWDRIVGVGIRPIGLIDLGVCPAER